MNKQRLGDAILPIGQGFNQYYNREGTLTDPMYGAVNGYAPEYREWVSAVQERIQHGIPFLIDAPAGFEYLTNDPMQLVAQLRAIMELHPRKIEGFEAGLQLENADIPWGGGGQKLHVFTNVTRDQTSWKSTTDDKEGAPIRRFWEYYIQMLMANEESKVPGVATLSRRPKHWLPDMWTFTMGFIIPDPLHQYVKQSWIVTNMCPKDGFSGITASRELEAAMQTRQYSHDFGGLAAYGPGIDAYCQKYLDRMNLAGANPALRKAWVEDLYVENIDADVLATMRGFLPNINLVREKNAFATA